MRPRPSPAVVGWVAGRGPASLFTTAICAAEIRVGLALLAPGKRRDSLVEAAEAVFNESLAGRVLPFDTAAAGVYARLVAGRRATGRNISQFDAQIAAIAALHDATLATRNITDFQGCGLRLVNPWGDEP